MKNQDFMDILNIMSFAIGVENLDSNLDQDTMQQLLGKTVKDIHNHLELQDKKLDMIIKKLEELENDKNQKTG